MKPTEITLEVNPGGTWRFDYQAWGLRIKFPDGDQILVFHHNQEGIIEEDLTVQHVDTEGKISLFLDTKKQPFDPDFWYNTCVKDVDDT